MTCNKVVPCRCSRSLATSLPSCLRNSQTFCLQPSSASTCYTILIFKHPNLDRRASSLQRENRRRIFVSHCKFDMILVKLFRSALRLVTNSSSTLTSHAAPLDTSTITFTRPVRGSSYQASTLVLGMVEDNRDVFIRHLRGSSRLYCEPNFAQLAPPASR